ncbi:hypothetical protein C7C56_011470 [Massilia glaciei]|uniref:Uncharacterized protein n=1 Tax=Massilia glaciei TaxID=1524097 RepID=A0A2U2HLV5_9BURK|nr:hypothetical protein C7C56_011470 [Massilia glaciei]
MGHATRTECAKKGLAVEYFILNWTASCCNARVISYTRRLVGNSIFHKVWKPRLVLIYLLDTTNQIGICVCQILLIFSRANNFLGCSGLDQASLLSIANDLLTCLRQ